MINKKQFRHKLILVVFCFVFIFLNSQVFAAKISVSDPNQESTAVEPPSFPPLTIGGMITAQDCENRKEFISNLITQNPFKAYTYLIPRDFISEIPAKFRFCTEKLVTKTGILETYHYDDFDRPENSRFSYTLTEKNNKRYPLYIADSELSLVSGTTIKVSGYLLNEKLITQSRDVTKLKSPPKTSPKKYLLTAQVGGSSSEAIGEQKILAVLIKFTDSPADPFTVKQAEKMIFKGHIEDFYKEASYDQISFSGKVVGWYTVPRSGAGNPWVNVGVDYDPDGIYPYLRSQGIILSDYQRLVFFVNYSGGGVSTVGKIDLGSANAKVKLSLSQVGVNGYDNYWGEHPFKWTNFDFVFSHEFGHGLGLWHANSWECDPPESIGSTCAHLEYGNRFDVMGYGVNSLHFNAFYKEILGWLSPSSILTITRPGAYTLNALESKKGVRAAKIQTSTNRFPYYIEFRDGGGFDKGMIKNSTARVNEHGVMVNFATASKYSIFSRLLDMTPTQKEVNAFSDDWLDVALTNQVFSDQGRGVVLGPVREDKKTMSFNVNFITPVCTNRDPLIAYLPQEITISPNSQSYVYYGVKNIDSVACGSSPFLTSFETPISWSAYQSGDNPIILDLEGDYPESRSMSLRVPPEAVDGAYNVFVTVTNMRSNRATRSRIRVIIDRNVSPPFAKG